MSLQDKLDQAETDKRVGIVAADLEIERIKRQIADAEAVYGSGDRFIHDNAKDKYMLSEVGNGSKHELCFVDMQTGRGNNEVCHYGGDLKRVSKSFLEDMDGHLFSKLTRYWDNRKQKSI